MTLAALVLLGTPTRGTATEATPIPRDLKPRFAPLIYLVGTWNCHVNSSRRPQTFPAKAITHISDDGYWMVTVTTTPPVPWNPIQVVAHDYLTYDPTRGIWVDIMWDNYGLYTVSISKRYTADQFVWVDTQYPRSHATATHLPRIFRKTSDRTTESKQRFVEPSGATFDVLNLCSKQ